MLQGGGMWEPRAGRLKGDGQPRVGRVGRALRALGVAAALAVTAFAWADSDEDRPRVTSPTQVEPPHPALRPNPGPGPKPTAPGVYAHTRTEPVSYTHLTLPTTPYV